MIPSRFVSFILSPCTSEISHHPSSTSIFPPPLSLLAPKLLLWWVPSCSACTLKDLGIWNWTGLSLKYFFCCSFFVIQVARLSNGSNFLQRNTSKLLLNQTERQHCLRITFFYFVPRTVRAEHLIATLQKFLLWGRLELQRILTLLSLGYTGTGEICRLPLLSYPVLHSQREKHRNLSPSPLSGRVCGSSVAKARLQRTLSS